jgi:hypothetical protein
VLTVDHRFALSNPALLSALSKKSFSSVSSPILACSDFTSRAGSLAPLPLPGPNTSAEVELAIVVITQTFTTPGVELAGPLPPEIQFDTNFGGAVSATSKSADAARDLLIFLKKPTAIGVIKAQGMEPI